jgi:hypothetical protein
VTKLYSNMHYHKMVKVKHLLDGRDAEVGPPLSRRWLMIILSSKSCPTMPEILSVALHSWKEEQ